MKPNRLWEKNNPDKKKAIQEKYYAPNPLYVRDGLRWTICEDERLLKSDKSDKELSFELKRTLRGIQIRRSRLKKNPADLKVGWHKRM